MVGINLEKNSTTSKQLMLYIKCNEGFWSVLRLGSSCNFKVFQ